MNMADKNEELLEVLDENGKSLCKFENRALVHKNQIFHNEVALWVVDVENRKVLLQRRSPNKKLNPNKLGLCAGHVVKGETIMQALKKEAFEEIGVDIEKYKVKTLLTIKRRETNNYCFSHHFAITEHIPLDQIKIQQEEVSEVLYMDYEKFKSMIKNGDEQVFFVWNNEYQKLFACIDEIIYK